MPKAISLYEFGGSEEMIRRAQEPFVKFFLNSAPILDIGCGRGTFLELLSAAGLACVGIDHSEEALAACQRKGFRVYRDDAISFLRKSPASFGGIFCSHVIEHMAYNDALEFLGLCRVALRPGGVLLLVTPNPDDWITMSEIFWLDPTHVRPYPKSLLESMLKSVGFEIRLAKHFLGNWRLIGRRKIPGYLFRRLLLSSRHYGKPNTLVVAERIETPAEP
jgi:2-polyprenyl-3-methyl-5-hydroxy-6-metoxy-1,4-benzoquinol methylase